MDRPWMLTIQDIPNTIYTSRRTMYYPMVKKLMYTILAILIMTSIIRRNIQCLMEPKLVLITQNILITKSIIPKSTPYLIEKK